MSPRDKVSFYGWFKLALQTVERFGKSFSTRFTKSRYKVSSKLTGHLNHARFFNLLFVGYVAIIVVWFVFWFIEGDGRWLLTLINRVVPYLFLPVPLFLLYALLSHQFKIILPMIFPTLISGSFYFPCIFPKPAISETETGISVMTFNVLFSNFDDVAIANVILAYQPDLVALQEVQPDMMNALEKQLDAEYPYSQMGFENEYGTTAVFSRHSFTNSYVIDLQADRPAVVIKTEIADQEVTFIAAHLRTYGLWWVDWVDLPAVVMERTAE